VDFVPRTHSLFERERRLGKTETEKALTKETKTLSM